MTKADCAAFLREHDNYCILTHESPDGDTLGSAATLCLGLRSLGKTAFVLENPETPKDLKMLCQGLTVEAPAENATLVSVDVAAPHMLVKNPNLGQKLPELRIDHHEKSTSFTPFELVDATCASCAEIIYDLLVELGVELTREMAVPLYVGLSTDTGCFRFANTNAHTYTTAAACAATGADLQPITQLLFDTVSLDKLRVQAWVTENTRFLAEGKAAICLIPEGIAQQLQVQQEEFSGLSGFIRSIEGVCLAATLREEADKISISARAVPGYDASAVCEKFGGGGHKGAGGASTTLSLQEAEEKMVQAMLEQL